eukprot:11199361-Lingulodinium_polyedra.AAC.1
MLRGASGGDCRRWRGHARPLPTTWPRAPTGRPCHAYPIGPATGLGRRNYRIPGAGLTAAQ